MWTFEKIFQGIGNSAVQLLKSQTGVHHSGAVFDL
jgi:hypothetical protein